MQRWSGIAAVSGALLIVALMPVLSLDGPAPYAQGSVPMIADGDFDLNLNSRMLRNRGESRGWYESRGDGKIGRSLLQLSKKSVGGNATKKAMLKADPAGNAYLSQSLREPQKGKFSLQWDIYVRSILTPPNRGGFMILGNDSVKKRGPNATGAERFAFLAFENASPGKVNLVAMEDGAAGGAVKSRVIVPDLPLKKWHTVRVDVDVPGKSYLVSVAGVTAAPVPVKAFVTKGNSVPKEITHISFATWNDGPGTIYIDNVK